MVKETEYYNTLGLNPSAKCDENDIKKAYRKMALTYHPDKNSSADAAEMFKKVGEAYEVLSNPEKKKIYDDHGKAGVQQGGAGMGGGAGGAGGMGHFSAEDIFSTFFGGGGRGAGGRSGPPKPRDILVTIELSLEEIYNGTTKVVQVLRRRRCGVCDGTRSAKKTTRQCPTCRGAGKVIALRQVGIMQMQTQVTCTTCDGRGTVVVGPICSHCQGRAVVHSMKKFSITIERGMEDSEVIHLEGEGDQLPSATASVSGDILIVFEELSHPNFIRRDKGDLWVRNVHITLSQALCGVMIPLEHLDGRILKIRSNGGSNSVLASSQYAYSVYREGMPIASSGGNERGNLYLDIRIHFPKEPLSETQRNLVQRALVEGGGNTQKKEDMISEELRKQNNSKVKPVTLVDYDFEAEHSVGGSPLEISERNRKNKKKNKKNTPSPSSAGGARGPRGGHPQQPQCQQQ